MTDDTRAWGYPTDLPKMATQVGDKVAYSWARCQVSDDHTHTIGCLWVWHWCDHNLWHADPSRDPAHIPYDGWVPAGVGAHDLISIEPLHIEASVYWPDCCGLHGWIRDGKWTGA